MDFGTPQEAEVLGDGCRVAMSTWVRGGSAFAKRPSDYTRAGDFASTQTSFATTPPDVEVTVPVNDFWRNGIKLLPSYANSPYDAVVAMDLIRAGRVPVNEMITHRLSLKEAGLGFQLVAEADESIKVIIEPHKF